MEEVTIIGINLAKRSFQVHGAKADGSVAFRRKLSRGKVLSFLASQPPCTVAMEACAGAHYWAGRSRHSAGSVAGSKEWPVGLFALAVREAGDQEVEELARDGPATAVPGGARERLDGRPPSWLETPSLTLGVRGPRPAPSAFWPATRPSVGDSPSRSTRRSETRWSGRAAFARPSSRQTAVRGGRGRRLRRRSASPPPCRQWRGNPWVLRGRSRPLPDRHVQRGVGWLPAKPVGRQPLADWLSKQAAEGHRARPSRLDLAIGPVAELVASRIAHPGQKVDHRERRPSTTSS